MNETLRLVTVESGGGEGNLLGTLTFDGETITSDTRIATDTADMLRRRSRKPDPALWAYLKDNGWSNGQVMLTE